nr:serine/threonine-protein kinase [Virgisporangium aliadipatigenens]
MSASPTLVAGRYRLIEPLGVGGMGRVWHAWDQILGRDVAIKEIVPPEELLATERDDMRRRTLREARAAARLNHPNVVRVYDVFETGDKPWIVMEYVPSRSLQEVIVEDGPLPPARAAEIGLGVLAALHAAHRAGVMHRDVKPSNVLLSDDGRVVLTDFGIASVEGDSTVTRPGLVLGSPAYIAPERAREGIAGPASDLWSLGATLYAAVEGRSPYERSSPIATLTALASEEPDPAKNAGVLRGALNGLLRKDPALRIDAVEAERRLRRAASSGGSARRFRWPWEYKPWGNADERPVSPAGSGPVSPIGPPAPRSAPPPASPPQRGVPDAPHTVNLSRLTGPPPPRPIAEQPPLPTGGQGMPTAGRRPAPAGPPAPGTVNLSRIVPGIGGTPTVGAAPTAPVSLPQPRGSRPPARPPADATSVLPSGTVPPPPAALAGGPTTVVPTSGAPTSGAPTSGAPASGAPASGGSSRRENRDRSGHVTGATASLAARAVTGRQSGKAAGRKGADDAPETSGPSAAASAQSTVDAAAAAGSVAEVDAPGSPTSSSSSSGSSTSSPESSSTSSAWPASSSSSSVEGEASSAASAGSTAGGASAAVDDAVTTSDDAGTTSAGTDAAGEAASGTARDSAASDVGDGAAVSADASPTSGAAVGGAAGTAGVDRAGDAARTPSVEDAVTASDEDVVTAADAVAADPEAVDALDTDSVDGADTALDTRADTAPDARAQADLDARDDADAADRTAVDRTAVDQAAAAAEEADSDGDDESTAAGTPLSAEPGSAAPTSGAPTSGVPTSGAPTSGAPASGVSPTASGRARPTFPWRGGSSSGSTRSTSGRAGLVGRPVTFDKSAGRRSTPDATVVQPAASQSSITPSRAHRILASAAVPTSLKKASDLAERRRVLVGVIALVLFLLIGLAVVFGDGDGDDKPSGTPTGSTPTQGAPASSAPQAGQSPGGSSPAVESPAAPPPPASSGPVNPAYVERPPLPEGWYIYYERLDRNGGFSVYLPNTYRPTFRRNGGAKYEIVRFSVGGRTLEIDQTDTPQPNPVADWQGQRDRRRSAGDFPGYEEVKIAPVTYFQNAADWEFTFNSGGGRSHVNNRGFVVSPTKAYGIWYQSPDADWGAARADLEIIFNSFRVG